MEPKIYPSIDPEDLCPNYVPGERAIPEEIPTCDLCRHYSPDDTCHYPEVTQ